MRQRMWRRLCAAAFAAVVLAGSAAAQNPTPAIAIPQANGAALAQPAPTLPSVAGSPAASAGTVVPPTPGAVIVKGSGGCTNCTTPGVGTAARGFVMGASGGYFGTNCQTGQACNSGCGSLRSDAGFAFGSCKQFFAPCGPTPCGGHFGKCRTPVGGTGPCGPFNPCVYDSYLNH